MKPKKLSVPVETLRALHQGGMTYAQIGERFGVSRNTVSNYLHPHHYQSQNDKRKAKAKAERGDKPKQQRAKDVPSGKPFRIEDYIWPQNNITVVMPQDTRDLTGRLLGDPIRGVRKIIKGDA
jgi:transcriptional regulator with XRE-family HTH domain